MVRAKCVLRWCDGGVNVYHIIFGDVVGTTGHGHKAPGSASFITTVKHGSWPGSVCVMGKLSL